MMEEAGMQPTSIPVGTTPAELAAGHLEETLAEKIARYTSPQFKAALIAHFHRAKRRALNEFRSDGPIVDGELPKR
jgi:hypothetical protein